MYECFIKNTIKNDVGLLEKEETKSIIYNV